MVRGLVAAAHLFVDAGVGHQVGGLRAEQQVVDADAVVAFPRADLIIPEGVEAALRQPGADRVGEAEVQQAAEGGAGIGQIERVLQASGSETSLNSGITL